MHRVKQALFDGGIGRSNKPEGVRNTPGIQRWQDLVGVSRARGTASMWHRSECQCGLLHDMHAAKAHALSAADDENAHNVISGLIRIVSFIVDPICGYTYRRSYTPGSRWRMTGSSWSTTSLRYVTKHQLRDSLAPVSSPSMLYPSQNRCILQGKSVMSQTSSCGHDCLSPAASQGCQTMIAIETAKLKLGKPDRESAYWN